MINRKYLKGFTLIELLVVITILGLLASIIMVSLGEARKSARDARRISEIKQVTNVLEQYYMDRGHYPDYSNQSDPAGNWNNMINELDAAGYFAESKFLKYAQHTQKLSLKKAFFGKIALAMAPPLPVDPKIQDPSYPDIAYEYMSDLQNQDYRIRASIENPNNPVLLNSMDGPFLSALEPQGDNACDSSLGYYCIGTKDSFDPGRMIP